MVSLSLFCVVQSEWTNSSLLGQGSNEKGTPLDAYNSLQGDSPTNWDDTVLNRLDKFMVKAHGYGIKLLISLHSYNALEGNRDFYGKWYGTGDFYTNSAAIESFKTRIAHVLAHVNPNTGKTWSQSSEYIFAFEAQNEAMHPQVPSHSLKGRLRTNLTFRAIRLRWHHGSVPWHSLSRTT